MPKLYSYFMYSLFLVLVCVFFAVLASTMSETWRTASESASESPDADLELSGVDVQTNAVGADQGNEPVAAATTNARRPTSDDELKYWLQNMVWYHQFSQDEISEATDLNQSEIAEALDKFDIQPDNNPQRDSKAALLVLPYPGGRHPRIGFLEGAIQPQRETKVSVFTPWANVQAGWRPDYVVVDAPEAIWSNLGLTYLAHTHVPTVWTRRNIQLEKLEWNRRKDGTLDMRRTLPNGIEFGTKIMPTRDAVHMEMWLKNGTQKTLTDMRVQNCVMLKGAAGFNEQTTTNKVQKDPYIACRSDNGQRWIISAWVPCFRTWVNRSCPCLHSDPMIPDCKPGDTQRLKGWLSFYDGESIESEFARIEKTGWKKRSL